MSSRVSYPEKWARLRRLFRGVRGHSYRGVDWAIDYLANGRLPYREITAPALRLSEVDQAIRQTGSSEVVHVSVDPWS